MRRIMNGAAYDTETAELVKEAHWEADGVYGDRVHRLYRTRHGAFFFYRRYEGMIGDPDTGEEEQVLSETLSPCTDEHAREWLEKYADNLVEQYFGEMPEAGAAERRFTLRMPNNLARRLETKAGEIPLTRYINRCIERCLGEEGVGADTEEKRGGCSRSAGGVRKDHAAELPALRRGRGWHSAYLWCETGDRGLPHAHLRQAQACGGQEQGVSLRDGASVRGHRSKRAVNTGRRAIGRWRASGMARQTRSPRCLAGAWRLSRQTPLG
jgi:hypothetical protein